MRPVYETGILATNMNSAKLEHDKGFEPFPAVYKTAVLPIKLIVQIREASSESGYGLSPALLAVEVTRL